MKLVLTEKQIKRIIQENLEELDYQSFREDENLQDLRDSIDKNKLVSVAFVKKDGSVKHMLVRKSLSSYVGSEREKTDAQMNVESNHNIKKVVDVNAYKREIKTIRNENPEMEDSLVKQMAAKKAWRSINLTTVLGFMVSGRFIDLRDENEIMDRFGEEVYNSLTKSMVAAMTPVENNPDNPEGDVNEQGLLGMIKNTVSPSIKVVKNVRNFADDLKYISRQSKSIMGKFGVVVNTAKVRQIMVPVNDTLPIIAHEFNNLKGKFTPNFNIGTGIKTEFENLKNTLRVPEGGTLNLSLAYHQAEELKYYLNRMKEGKMVTPAGVGVVNKVEAQINTIMQEMEVAVSQIATAK
jgi:hypothetical protein